MELKRLKAADIGYATVISVAALTFLAAALIVTMTTRGEDVGITYDPAPTIADFGPHYDEVTDPEFTGYPEVNHCPVTADEIIMLCKTMYQEAQVVYWNGDRFGVSYKARQAAVAWTALNRLDTGEYGETLAEVLTAPGQFAYQPDNLITAEMMALAEDVVERWWNEKLGYSDVGRVLPADYLWFDGDGRENYFRNRYSGPADTWDWSLPDPYKEG